MSKALLVCLFLACAITFASAQGSCPPGLEGPECSMCIGDTPAGDAACANLTASDSAWCYTNHTWAEGSTTKTYECTTDGTQYQSVVSNVWAHCDMNIQKCDVHFSLGAQQDAITCSGLNCNVDANDNVFCSYTKCSCDSSCPSVDGVSAGYMLSRLTGTTALHCKEDQWPYALCSFDIQGLSSASSGFQAFCKASECRKW